MKKKLMSQLQAFKSDTESVGLGKALMSLSLQVSASAKSM